MTVPPAAAQTIPPDPPQDRPPAAGDGPTSTPFLLGLVRKLIDYGRQLAATLRQPPPAASLPCSPHYAGTFDIGPILARIARGLHLAAALEARLLRRPPQKETPAPTCPSAPCRPRATRPAARPAAAADPNLARLPTAEEIAAQVRRRPIGAVLVDICRDLGIVPAHPLWRELQLAIIANGGNLATLVKDVLGRIKASITGERDLTLPAPLAASPLAAASATGPP